MNGLELCVWLNGCEGLSANVLQHVDLSDGPEKIVEKLRRDGIVSQRCADRLEKLARENWHGKEIERAENAGIFLISWYSNERYPSRLRGIAEPPLILYAKGNVPDFESAYSIVGTRRCTPYGFKVAALIGNALSRAGMVVVSGGARGIDGAAHGGALENDGVTVAVLGTGADVVWPPEHDELFDNILRRGALLSEYPLGTCGRTWRFPRRNRIIAGLSKALIVVESPLKGGAMITARLAMEMGRDVWAVPGRIDERICEGSNRLILDGASPLVNVADFIDHVSHFGQLDLFAPLELGDDERRVLDCLSDQGDLTLDQISKRTGISAVELMRLISELQVQSLIYTSGGGRWRAVPH